MIKILDNYLKKIALYRLTLYVLVGLVLSAFVLSFFGSLPFDPWDILLSTSIILSVGFITNYIFSSILGARTNNDSVWITLLILVLIFSIKFPADFLFIVLATVLAIASKYLLTVEKRHIFNPAAVSAVAVALLYPDKGAIWWIGTPAMLPFVILGGLLLVRKIKGESLVLTFLATYLVATAIGTILHSGSWSSVLTGWQLGITHSALLFFTFIMLTEPLTSPPNRKKRLYFAVLVALLYSTLQLRILGLSFTPEMALCLGNMFAYFIRLRKQVPNQIINDQARNLGTVVNVH